MASKGIMLLKIKTSSAFCVEGLRKAQYVSDPQEISDFAFVQFFIIPIGVLTSFKVIWSKSLSRKQ